MLLAQLLQLVARIQAVGHLLVFDDATGRGSDPAAQAQLTELQHEVKRAISALPPKLRSAVVMHDLEGLSYEEVALAVGCPVGTVKSRLFNGRNLLKEKLRRYVETD